MKSALAGTLERARSTFATISLGQRVVIGLLLTGLLLGAFTFYSWITTPTQAPLFSNLAATDASAIVEELNAAGVTYTLADGGTTIMVAKDAVYDLRLSMSGKGLPAGAETGYALLDEQGITTSEFQQQVTYQRALEGELSKTLESLAGVRQAVVHVALPEDEVFVTEQEEATASVLLDLAPGTQLAGEQITAVTNLVSSSVQGMSPEQVTVADSSGQVLAAAGSGLSAGASDARTQAEQDYEDRLRQNAQQILDRIVGPQRSVVSVRADVDMSQRTSTSERYDYRNDTPPLSSSETRETYQGDGAAVGGVLGPENTADALENTGDDGGSNTYEKSASTENNAVDKTTTTEQQVPGGIKRLTVSVVMDAAVAGALDQGQIEDLVGNAVGLDAVRGDAVTVAVMPFDTAAADRAAAEMEAAREAESSEKLWSLVRSGAIAAVIALVVLVVWLRSRGQQAVGAEYEPLALDEEVLAELERLRVESSRGDGSRAGGRPELRAAEQERVRGEIAAMVSERPDEVAAMLRGWLTENPATRRPVA